MREFEILKLKESRIKKINKLLFHRLFFSRLGKVRVTSSLNTAADMLAVGVLAYLFSHNSADKRQIGRWHYETGFLKENSIVRQKYLAK